MFNTVYMPRKRWKHFTKCEVEPMCPWKHISVGDSQTLPHPMGKLTRGRIIAADSSMAEVQESMAIRTSQNMGKHHLFTMQSKQKQTSGETGARVEIEPNWDSESHVTALAPPGVTLRRAVKYLSTCFLRSSSQEHLYLRSTPKLK